MSSVRTGRRRAATAALAGLVLLAGACTSTESSTREPARARTRGRAPAATVEALRTTVDGAPACDWLDPSQCLFPFPSSRFEVADRTTDTGRRLAIPVDAMPRNVKGVAVDPEPFARSDGWGVGTPIMFSAPGVDPDASRFPSEADPSTSMAPGSGTVVLDLTTGERIAHWTELDDRPELEPGERTTVLVHPLVMLPEGHHIAVGVAAPVDARGDALAPSAGFRVVRDRLTTGIEAIEDRRDDLDGVIDALDDAGLPRDEQWLAWDFTVMSTGNLTGELLHMRDVAFEALGDAAPAYRVTEVRTTDDDGGPLPAGVAKRIRGTFDVPKFVSGDGGPGTTMVRDGDGMPRIDGTYAAPFSCSVTTGQLAGPDAARPVVYGHGLLGDYRESERGDLGAAAAGLMLCATYWTGMSEPDIGYAVGALQDINGFPSVADRLRQGVVDQLFLARLLHRPDGLAADPELRRADGRSSLDTSEVFYEGHSQGGIMGFAATAVSTEWTKAVIGVPGVDYALLIPRSDNWQRYGPVIDGGYPGAVEGLLVLALLQQQWDRAEGSGYVRYLTDRTLPGTPKHQVLVEVALGDHQVANASAEIAARTAGVPVRTPAVAAGRLPWKQPSYGLERVPAGRDARSLLVYWDAGTLPPGLGDRSPDTSVEHQRSCATDDGSAACVDPHEFPRRTPAAQEQRNRFFETGVIPDVCGSGPCRTEPRSG